MRGFALASLLLAGGIAGCLTNTPDAGLQAADIVVPDGAVLEEVEGAFELVWDALPLPAEVPIEVPEGATIVRAMVNVPGDRNSLWLVNDDTGRRRCNTETSAAWNRDVRDDRSCSALTVVDGPDAIWRLEVNGDGSPEVRVRFESTPITGLAASIHSDLLSLPTHALQDTQAFTIESFDGTPLWAELTLPEGGGPWPTIIAASPYNEEGVRGEPAMWEYWAQDWAKRGYAVLVTDVRGFGNSGGCVEVWGDNEARDQAFTVDWVARQPWSDGSVGFYGQSYVATTPIEAAVFAPEALKAVIAVAPVMNAYEDWHYGGVPNGESFLSPLVGYQAGFPVAFATGTAGTLQAGTIPDPPEDPPGFAQHIISNLCDPGLTAEANDPRFVYQEFYAERDFKTRADQITAAVLFTQGFEDSNVKSQMIPDWFNEVTAPKLGLFGHWVHQHPPRADGELLMLAWMDQYVKGKDMGLDALPNVDVYADRTMHRTAVAWPEPHPETVWYPDLAGDGLSGEPTEGSAGFLSAPIDLDPGAVPVISDYATHRAYRLDIDDDFALSGAAVLDLVGTMDVGPNGFLAAEIHRANDNGTALVTFGMTNLAHRGDHTQYRPYSPGEAVDVALGFLPTEAVFHAGEALVLVIGTPDVAGDLTAGATTPAAITLHGGAEGTMLRIPGPSPAAYEPIPPSGLP